MSEFSKNTLLAGGGSAKSLQGKTWTVLSTKEQTTVRTVVNSAGTVAVRYSPWQMGGTTLTKLYYNNTLNTDITNWSSVAITETTYTIIWDSVNNRFIRYVSNGYYTSTDGATWTFTSATTSFSNYNNVAYINGTYYVVDWLGNIYSSSTGVGSWTSVGTAPISSVYDMAYYNGVYVLVGSNSSIYYSTNLTSWTNAVTTNCFYVYRVKWVPFLSKFVATGYGQSLYYSNDGMTWTASTVPTSYQQLYDFFWDSTTVYIPTTNGYYSTTNLTTITSNTINGLSGVAMYTGVYSSTSTSNKYYFSGADGSYGYGADSTNPSGFQSYRPPKLKKLAFSPTFTAPNVAYVAAQDLVGPYIATSNNAINWGSSTVSGGNSTITYNDVMWDAYSSQYFAVGTSNSGGEIVYSTNGNNWYTTYTNYTSSIYGLYAIASNNAGTIVAVGINGTIVYSTNSGSTWTLTSVTTWGSSLTGVTWDSTRNQFIATGGNRVIYSSSNGITWTLQQYLPIVRDMIKFGGKYIATVDYLNNIGSSPYCFMVYASNIQGLWKPLFSSSFSNYQYGRWLITDTAATIAVATTSSEIYYSTDTVNGTTWSKATVSVTGGITNLLYVNGYFMAMSNGSGNASFVISTDGVTWTTKTISLYSTASIHSIEYYNSYYYAYLSNAKIVRSTDLTTWTDIFDNTSAGGNPNWANLVAAYGNLYAFSYSGSCYKYDGSTWTVLYNAVYSQNLSSVTYARYVGSNIFITTFSGMFYSSDGTNWAVAPFPNMGYYGDARAYKVNHIGDGRVVYTQGASGSDGSYYWQKTSTFADGLIASPRGTTYKNITYIPNGDYTFISADTLITVNGNAASDTTYSDMNNITYTYLVTSGNTFFQPTRVACNNSASALSYASGSTQGAGFYYRGTNVNGWTLSPTLGSNYVTDVMWNGTNYLAIAANVVYKSN